MASKMESIIKDYIFVAILISFVVYKLPRKNESVIEIAPNIGILEYQQKEALFMNSILQSGIQLLDIKLELENSVVNKSNDLVAYIRFDSFGNVPTLIDLNYVITDLQGKEVYKEIGDITVETEKSLTKDFKKLNLRKGKYTLTLTTLYNTDVKDEFRQEFEVKGASPMEVASWTILVIAILGIGGSIIYKLIKLKQER